MPSSRGRRSRWMCRWTSVPPRPARRRSHPVWRGAGRTPPARPAPRARRSARRRRRPRATGTTRRSSAAWGSVRATGARCRSRSARSARRLARQPPCPIMGRAERVGLVHARALGEHDDHPTAGEDRTGGRERAGVGLAATDGERREAHEQPPERPLEELRLRHVPERPEPRPQPERNEDADDGVEVPGTLDRHERFGHAQRRARRRGRAARGDRLSSGVERRGTSGPGGGEAHMSASLTTP